MLGFITGLLIGGIIGMIISALLMTADKKEE